MNEIEKLIQIIDENDKRNKRPARFFWWLFIFQLVLLGILVLIAVLIGLVS